MIKNKTIKVLKAVFFVIVIYSFINKSYAVDTEYFDNNISDYTEVGIAVIEDKQSDTTKYYYLFYDDTGRAHIVQYVYNEMRDKEEEKWTLKTDPDITKAKELGAKEFYAKEEEIKQDEKPEATELYNEIIKEEAIGHAYDYIEGSDEDLAPTSIEDVIFNNISIFDVNVFKDTAAGKEVKEDSVVGILRKIIATWYIAFRNVAFVILSILIIYYGLRMAIATTAEGKATYKAMLFNWLKGLVLVIFIHWIMYIILNANDMFVNSLENINYNEDAIYNTIKTRAFAWPWKVSLPALFIYITLFIMLIRFLWVYIKRTFAVLYLIILAPLVVSRYVIESASGKSSDIVVNWIKKFSTAVFIQSIHAMVYVIFVGPVIVHSLDNLLGFIIALFFLNFMLTADKIFTNIFRDNFEPKQAEKLDERFDPQKYLAEIIAAQRLGTIVFGAVGGVGRFVALNTRGLVQTGYMNAMNIANQTIDENFQDNVEGKLRNATLGAADRLERINDAVIRRTQTTIGENNRKPRFLRVKTQLNSWAAEGNRLIKAKKIYQQGRIPGEYAKHFIKLRLNEYGRRFTSPFKIIKNVGMGVAESIIVLPLTVVSPKMGGILLTRIPSRFKKASDLIDENNKMIEEYVPDLEDAITSLVEVEDSTEKIEEIYDKLSETEQKEAKKQLKKIKDYKINTTNIEVLIMKAMRRYNLQNMDESDISRIVDSVIDSLPDELTQSQKNSIKARTVQLFMERTREANRRINLREQEIEELEEGEEEAGNIFTNDNQETQEGNQQVQDQEMPEEDIEQDEVIEIHAHEDTQARGESRISDDERQTNYDDSSTEETQEINYGYGNQTPKGREESGATNRNENMDTTIPKQVINTAGDSVSEKRYSESSNRTKTPPVQSTGSTSTEDGTSANRFGNQTTQSTGSTPTEDRTSDNRYGERTTQSTGSTPTGDRTPVNGFGNRTPQDTGRRESRNNTNNMNGTSNQNSSRMDQRANETRNTREPEPRNIFSDIVDSIQQATIEETVDKKFIKMAKEVNKIDSINRREHAKEDSEGEILNINRFIDRL